MGFSCRVAMRIFCRRMKRLSVVGALPSMDHWNTDVSLTDFKALQTIGESVYGMTIKVVRKATGSIHLLKLLKKEELHRSGKMGSVETERKLLLQMRHPLIIELDHSFQALDFLGLVYRYTGNVDLYYHLQRVKRFPESVARIQVAEVISAIGFLHSRGYVHRDVRPENIMVDNQGHTRLKGLGLAKNVGIRSGNIIFPSTNTFCGTIEYVSPEMLLNNSEHDVRADWWAVGVLLYELTSGIPPFYSRSVKRLYHRILNAKPKLFPLLSKHCKDLIKQLLQKDRSQRRGTKGDASEVLKHPFFCKMSDQALRARVYPVPWNFASTPAKTNSKQTLAFSVAQQRNKQALNLQFLKESKHKRDALGKGNEQSLGDRKEDRKVSAKTLGSSNRSTSTSSISIPDVAGNNVDKTRVVEPEERKDILTKLSKSPRAGARSRIVTKIYDIEEGVKVGEALPSRLLNESHTGSSSIQHNQLHADSKERSPSPQRRVASVHTSLTKPLKSHRRGLSNVSEDESLAFTQGSLAGKLSAINDLECLKEKTHGKGQDESDAFSERRLSLDGKKTHNPLATEPTSQTDSPARQSIDEIRSEMAMLRMRLKKLEESEKRIFLSQRNQSRRNSAGLSMARSLAEALSEEHLVEAAIRRNSSTTGHVGEGDDTSR